MKSLTRHAPASYEARGSRARVAVPRRAACEPEDTRRARSGLPPSQSGLPPATRFRPLQDLPDRPRRLLKGSPLALPPPHFDRRRPGSNRAAGFLPSLPGRSSFRAWSVRSSLARHPLPAIAWTPASASRSAASSRRTHHNAPSGLSRPALGSTLANPTSASARGAGAAGREQRATGATTRRDDASRRRGREPGTRRARGRPLESSGRASSGTHGSANPTRPSDPFAAIEPPLLSTPRFEPALAPDTAWRPSRGDVRRGGEGDGSVTSLLGAWRVDVAHLEPCEPTAVEKARIRPRSRGRPLEWRHAAGAFRRARRRRVRTPPKGSWTCFAKRCCSRLSS